MQVLACSDDPHGPDTLEPISAQPMQQHAATTSSAIDTAQLQQPPGIAHAAVSVLIWSLGSGATPCGP